MVFRESSQSLCQNRNLFPLDERGAGADALLGAAAGVQRDAGDAVVEHFFHEVGTGGAEGNLETGGKHREREIGNP